MNSTNITQKFKNQRDKLWNNVRNFQNKEFLAEEVHCLMDSLTLGGRVRRRNLSSEENFDRNFFLWKTGVAKCDWRSVFLRWMKNITFFTCKPNVPQKKMLHQTTWQWTVSKIRIIFCIITQRVIKNEYKQESKSLALYGNLHTVVHEYCSLHANDLH